MCRFFNRKQPSAANLTRAIRERAYVRRREFIVVFGEELAQLDSSGKERLRVSRLVMDVLDSGLDLCRELLRHEIDTRLGRPA